MMAFLSSVHPSREWSDLKADLGIYQLHFCTCSLGWSSGWESTFHWGGVGDVGSLPEIPHTVGQLQSPAPNKKEIFVPQWKSPHTTAKERHTQLRPNTAE